LSNLYPPSSTSHFVRCRRTGASAVKAPSRNPASVHRRAEIFSRAALARNADAHALIFIDDANVIGHCPFIAGPMSLAVF
jgi:hypothetical protein